jgi:glycerol dehydrogenase-like iron-containing ADH family enzyme
MIGQPFRCEEHPIAEVLADLGRYTVCANDPPWTEVSQRVSPAARVVQAWNMDIEHLEAVAAEPDDSEVVVGLGGGTALDTAKFLAWRRGVPLVQVPSITSVDAGFTDAIGVRVDGKVRYVATIVPQLVVLDLDLVRSAPPRLNRAGIGDILSCHTGLHDWRLATAAGHGHPWHEGLAALGAQLLDELEAAADEVHAVSETGVRFLADAYRRIGAACAWAGHSRFEEGSEHFWAYAYEHATGAHPVHGEIIAFAVCALAHVQGNDPERALSIVARSGARAHPDDLGVSRADFDAALIGLRAYARAEGLDIGVADLTDIDAATADAAWAFVQRLPRERGD